jgi:putative permease
VRDPHPNGRLLSVLQRSPDPDDPLTQKETRLLPDEQDWERAIFRALRKAIFLAVGLYVLFQFVEAVTFLLLFFALVLLLAAVLNPIVVRLQRHRVPRPIGAVLVVAAIVGGLVAVLWVAVPPLIDQGQQLVKDAPALWNSLRDRLERFLTAHPDLSAQLPTADQLVQRIGPTATRLVGQLGRYTLGLLGAALSLVLLLVLVIYCLVSPQPLVAGLLGAFPEWHRERAEQILGLILTRLKAWAMGSLVLGFIVGAMTWVGLYFLNVPFTLVFAVIAGVGELLPTLGPLLSAVPPLLVALATEPTQAIWVAALFLAVQQLENSLIVPMVMSRAIDVHPLSVTFMVLTMGTLFGVIGALLAVPAIVIIKTLYQELYQARHPSDAAALETRSHRLVSDAAGDARKQTPADKTPDASEDSAHLPNG